MVDAVDLPPQSSTPTWGSPPHSSRSGAEEPQKVCTARTHARTHAHTQLLKRHKVMQRLSEYLEVPTKVLSVRAEVSDVVQLSFELEGYLLQARTEKHAVCASTRVSEGRRQTRF